MADTSSLQAALAAVIEKRKAATKGPWDYYGPTIYLGNAGTYENHAGVIYDEGGHTVADAESIAAAANFIEEHGAALAAALELSAGHAVCEENMDAALAVALEREARLRAAVQEFLRRWDDPERYHRLPVVDDLRAALAEPPAPPKETT